MESLSGGFQRAAAFVATTSPLLVVDTELVIQDANPAYVAVMGRTRAELIGAPIFDAFPDNPDDRDGRGSRQLEASFEAVFRTARRDRRPLHRYDIPAPHGRGFARKHWIATNSPLRSEDGRVIGALHHPEDMTAVAELVAAAAEPGSEAPSMDQQLWRSLVATLAFEADGHRQAQGGVRELQRALESRVVIEQAKGMIAARSHIGVEEAFRRLRRHARDNNAGIHHVAQAVVDSRLVL